MSRALPITASAMWSSPVFPEPRPSTASADGSSTPPSDRPGVSPVPNRCSTVQRMVIWGQKTNLHGIPDRLCQRDERMGWMGDAHATAEEAIHNFDMAAFYANFLRNIRDVQDDQRTDHRHRAARLGIPAGRPGLGNGLSQHLLVCIQYYGDRRILEEQYDGLKKYVEFLRTKEENGLVKYFYYGDWVSVDKTPGSIVVIVLLLLRCRVLADMAKVLGKEQDAKLYSDLAETIKADFHKEYFDPKTGDYGNGTQTANTLALFLDFMPEN